jgi:RecB family exonuclease
LARLAAAAVPGAHPDEWYGLGAPSAPGPLRDAADPVRVSPSQVDTFIQCRLRWLLHKAGGTNAASTHQGFGDLIHEIARLVPDGDPERMNALLDRHWPELGLAPGWPARRQRERAERALEKFGDYARRVAAGRDLVAVEQPVRARIGRAEISGQVDRLERDEAGRLVVVDLKTGSTKPTAATMSRHAQLGVYQAAVEAGGFDAVAGAPSVSGGGLLVQLGDGTQRVGVQQQPPLSEDPDPTWARALVAQAAEGMAGEVFAAAPSSECRTCPAVRCCPAHPQGRQVTA